MCWYFQLITKLSRLYIILYKKEQNKGGEIIGQIWYSFEIFHMS